MRRVAVGRVAGRGTGVGERIRLGLTMHSPWLEWLLRGCQCAMRLLSAGRVCGGSRALSGARLPWGGGAAALVMPGQLLRLPTGVVLPVGPLVRRTVVGGYEEGKKGLGRPVDGLASGARESGWESGRRWLRE